MDSCDHAGELSEASLLWVSWGRVRTSIEVTLCMPSRSLYLLAYGLKLCAGGAGADSGAGAGAGAGVGAVCVEEESAWLGAVSRLGLACLCVAWVADCGLV